MGGAEQAYGAREGGGLSETAAVAWGGADYERLAATFGDIHERVVTELAPRPGEAFLDLACGTGGVAVVAARTGADVVGLDVSPDQLAKARAAAAEAGLAIRFDEGDCASLPYDDESYDVVASTFGFVFAGDHLRAAAELGRVCRPGARIALTTWRADEWTRVGERVGRAYPPGDDARSWAREDYALGLLGEPFELRFEGGTWAVRAGSADELWELLSSSTPLLKRWLQELEPGCRDNVEQVYLELLAGGELRRDYVLILGTRR